ncbi:MAG: hypothetical protein ABI051_18610 [Vicinamibacterales bacterium]
MAANQQVFRTSGRPEDALRDLLAVATAVAGIPYLAGKNARLEPSAWALLALSASSSPLSSARPTAEFLTAAQRPDGWLAEGGGWPVNVASNALVAFTWSVLPDLAPQPVRTRLLDALSASRGIQAPNEPHAGQDNMLQGWPWTDGTFSWVEPTAWGVLALKHARRRGWTAPGADARIDESERLLLNRTCRSGGWNFGNAVVMNQDLRAYIPTTALALLALQDRTAEPNVARSIEFLETHWPDELSSTATGLALLCLHALGRPVDTLVQGLRRHSVDAPPANFHGAAIALCALSASSRTNVFKL